MSIWQWVVLGLIAVIIGLMIVLWVACAMSGQISDRERRNGLFE